MLINLTALAYLLAAILFILSLRGLSSPSSARLGNGLGMLGMSIAIVATLFLVQHPVVELIALALTAGALIGGVVARRVSMTKMPELVALMHSFVGLAAVLIATAQVFHPTEQLQHAQKIELILGACIGAITFTASLIAYGKLSAYLSGTPIRFRGQHVLNLVIVLLIISLSVPYFSAGNHTAFFIMLILALALGITLIIPIGGADMPVVISMLNSYSGWAAAGIGFILNNPLLIIGGACVGASGAILSYIMCQAMNRSILSVLLGGLNNNATLSEHHQATTQHYKSGSPEDAAFIMRNAETVIIVPGYGLAVARAQHALKEFAEKLNQVGVSVKYAIHPVAGRMPGHMNVLLAEAEVPYEYVFEMDDINPEFGQTDVVLILGANDVVNPAAKNNPDSPIAGMPILEAYKAKTIIVNKRSMATGYAGLDNSLFYLDKTMMVFGDAKQVIEEMVKAI